MDETFWNDIQMQRRRVLTLEPDHIRTVSPGMKGVDERHSFRHNVKQKLLSLIQRGQ
jgi:hypothetical protein